MLGVETDGMQRTVGQSTMTLGGLLKHMALVEDSWFSRHMIEEYARHNGQADLIREAVDGSTGE